MDTSEIIDRLRTAAAAYPVDLFPPITKEEREALRRSLPVGAVDRISADMARHFATLMLDAARALEDLEAESKDGYTLTRKLGGLLNQSVNILRGEPPPLTLWSTHDVPELCAALVKSNERLTTYARIMKGTLEMLADSAKVCLELQEMEVARATRSKDELAAAAAEAGSEAGNVRDRGVPSNTQDAAEG